VIAHVDQGHPKKLVTIAASPTTEALRSASTAERNAAWRALYHDQFDHVYRLACRFGVPAADVEDVTQRVFVVAHRRIAEIEEIHNVGAWLRAIVVRVVAEHRRWARVRRVKHWVLRTSADVESPRPTTPERDLVALQAQRVVAQVLAKMSPKLRDVLVLLELEELSLQEAAETLGIPSNTVRSRKRLAREQFQRILEALNAPARHSSDG